MMCVDMCSFPPVNGPACSSLFASETTSPNGIAATRTIKVTQTRKVIRMSMYCTFVLSEYSSHVPYLIWLAANLLMPIDMMVISVKNNTTAKPIPNETGVLLTMPFMARAEMMAAREKKVKIHFIFRMMESCPSIPDVSFFISFSRKVDY